MDFKVLAKQDEADQRLIKEGGKSLELAISNIYMRYTQEIQSHYRRKGLNHELAEDLAQEVFIKILDNKDKLCDINMLGPWIWRVVFNNKADYFRKKETKLKNASVSDDELEHMQSEAVDTDSDELKNCVEQCFQQMAEKDEQRAYAFRLAVRYEWDNAQLAEFLGKKSKHATSEYISQSRKKIKPCLEACREL